MRRRGRGAGQGELQASPAPLTASSLDLPQSGTEAQKGGAACLHKLLTVGTPAGAEWDGQVPDTRAIPRHLSPSETPSAGAHKGRACSTPESPSSPGELGSGRRRRWGRGHAPPGQPPCSRPGLARAHPPPSTTCGPAGGSGLGEARPGGVRASLGALPGRVQVSWGQAWRENSSDRPGRGQPGGRPIVAREAADGPGQRERQAERRLPEKKQGVGGACMGLRWVPRRPGEPDGQGSGVRAQLLSSPRHPPSWAGPPSPGCPPSARPHSPGVPAATRAS